MSIAKLFKADAILLYYSGLNIKQLKKHHKEAPMKLILTLIFIFYSQMSFSQENESPINWTLTDINGVSHQFPQSETNKTTVVLFWATWCPYCKSLMPHLQSILYQYSDDLDLQIFALSINDDGDPNKLLVENGYDFLLFKEADAVAKKYNIKGTPGLLVFDKKGTLQFDLRKVNTPDNQDLGNNTNSQKAKKLAPYWASELRKTLNKMTTKAE